MKAAPPLPYYRSLLKEVLADRMGKNSRYSLRAYAKALGIEVSALSKIMSGKRFVTERLAARIFRALDLSAEEQYRFLQSVAYAKRSNGVGRLSPKLKKLLKAPPAEIPKDLSLEAFRAIADWYHAAILELTQTEDFRSDPRWIARKLGIGESECKLAIERLIELGLLVEEGGAYRKAERWIETGDRSNTSAAHRRRQKQVLQKSMESLENDPIEIRNHSAVTLPLDPEKIPEAKKRIDAFLRDLARFLSADSKKRVYELTVNLFPISQPSLTLEEK